MAQPAPASIPLPRQLSWEFPLPRTHTGIVLGNGVQGLMVWGDGCLHITVGRAGFWDHRSGNRFAARTTYQDIRRLLEAGDEAALRSVFASPQRKPGDPDRPQQIGGGRLELRFASGAKPVRADLDLESATLRVLCADGEGGGGVVTIRQAMDNETAWIDCDMSLGAPEVRLLPTWHWVGKILAPTGVQPPSEWGDANQGGFLQTLPEDPPLAVVWARRGGRLAIATALGSAGESDAAVTGRAKQLVASEAGPGLARATAWWREYWRDVPRVDLPDAELQRVWDYGLYKQGGMTTPSGIAATLQGPWMEEYQIPPWSNDYHFNINVQMIHWPALATNRCAHLEPMWAMIRGWLPDLRANAEHFFGCADGLMLPHAVDDRCAAVGSFWTGMIDHGCTAWMAQMAWLHYRHTLDLAILRDTAWPLLVGAFNGYWAMFEQQTVAGQPRLSLPVSVSPEFKGARSDAWGRDASFQLAAAHCVARILPRAAALLGQPVDPRWERVERELPAYTTVNESASKEYPEQRSTRIALWQGMDLIESHRHHSHLGAIYPFRTVDPADPAHASVVRSSLDWWTRQGPGMWSGWCLPWAAILNARCNRPDAAVAWLTWWREVFTNIGGGTLHDADLPGASLLYGGKAQEIMQMDAAMGALIAIQELLVQVRGDDICIMPAGIPRRWRRLRFDGMLTEGAFLVGATVAGGRVVEVRVESKAGGPLRLRHGLGDGVAGGPVLVRTMAPGERLVLTA